MAKSEQRGFISVNRTCVRYIIIIIKMLICFCQLEEKDRTS